VYPFERFTQDAKKTLTLAQEEAERAHHSYIGTEHLLLGLLRLPEGIAHEALTELGIEIDAVRDKIARAVQQEERGVLRQIIPTSRVKKVIEIAFEEAGRMHVNYVGSGHILMALAIEGEGIAAQVLQDMGADSRQVIATVDRLMRAKGQGREHEPWPVPEPPPPRPSADEGLESNVQSLVRLLQQPHIANLLRTRGLVDVEGLVAKLGDPPHAVVLLRGQMQATQKAERHIRQMLEEAEQVWLRSIIE
jgi:ATP-dependent Clp protease ATP-binding subunit ClpA